MRPDYSNQPASTTLPLLPFMPLTQDMKDCSGLVNGLNPLSNKALLDAMDALDDRV